MCHKKYTQPPRQKQKMPATRHTVLVSFPRADLFANINSTHPHFTDLPYPVSISSHHPPALNSTPPVRGIAVRPQQQWHMPMLALLFHCTHVLSAVSLCRK